ncbi:MAG: glucose 1-dehydrogenase [Cyanobacteria bacterium J06626_14]
MTTFTRRRLLSTGAIATAGLATALSIDHTNAQAETVPEPVTVPANPNGRFAGKVVLITGATSGIGATTAKAFAREGARVAFNGRRSELGQQVEQDIRAFGGEATYIQSDVRDVQQMERFVSATVEKYGRLDVAFNNAGVDYPPAATADTDIDSFDDLINTNARGVFIGMKYEIPHVLETNGSIINNASIGGHRAFPNIIGYGASKAAVIHMTKMVAQEYGKKIRVNAIAPGAIDTPMLDRVKRDWNVTEEQLIAPYPIQRVGQPQEVADAVMWLASDAASYVSGMRFDIDGGGLG